MQKSKKAVIVPFVTIRQAAEAGVEVIAHSVDARVGFENAKELLKTARTEVRIYGEQLRASGMKIEVRASRGTLAAEITAALRKMGYAPATAARMLSELRDDVNGATNPGKRRGGNNKKKAVQSGPVSGFRLELKSGTTPEIVKNRVAQMGEYLRMEYPENESMLRLAAYLADVVEA